MRVCERSRNQVNRVAHRLCGTSRLAFGAVSSAESDAVGHARNLCDCDMMSDAVVDYSHVKAWLDDIGYSGPCELEIFSEPDRWKRPPEETLRIAGERCTPFLHPRPPVARDNQARRRQDDLSPTMRPLQNGTRHRAPRGISRSSSQKCPVRTSSTRSGSQLSVNGYSARTSSKLPSLRRR